MKKIGDLFTKKKPPRPPGDPEPSRQTIRSLRRQVLALEDERDSLQEALDIAQGEILRIKTGLNSLESENYRLRQTAEGTMRANNSSQDQRFIMAGVVNRAREVAGAMVEPLYCLSEAVRHLPAPKDDNETAVLCTITESMGKIVRYAGMIAHDGSKDKLEAIKVTTALDADRRRRGETPLLPDQAPFDDDLKRLKRQKIKAWDISEPIIQRSDTGRIIVRGFLKRQTPGSTIVYSEDRIPFSVVIPKEDMDIVQYVTAELLSSVDEFERDKANFQA